MLERLMNNPFAWLILSIITVVSFIFCVYTWLIGKKKKEISTSQFSYEIIKAGKRQIPKLDVVYDGTNINNLIATKIYIWNSGNDVITSSDIVATKRFTIHSWLGADILDAHIIEEIDASNNFRIVNTNKHQVIVEFDYIDQGEGCSIQVLRTGTMERLNFDCKIKGGQKVRCCYENGGKTVPVVSKPIRILKKIIQPLTITTALWAYIFAGILQKVSDLNDFWLGSAIILLSMILGGLTSGLLSMLIEKKYNQRFHRDVPASLKGRC